VLSPPVDDVSDDLWIILVLKYLARWWCDKRVWNTPNKRHMKNVPFENKCKYRGRKTAGGALPFVRGDKFLMKSRGIKFTKASLCIYSSVIRREKRACVRVICLGPGRKIHGLCMQRRHSGTRARLLRKTLDTSHLSLSEKNS